MRIAADVETGCLERGQPRAKLRQVAPLLDVPTPDIGMARRQAEHLRTTGADHDRDPTGAWTDGSLLEVVRGVVCALEVGVSRPQQGHDDLERLLEAADHMIFRQAEGMALLARMP